MNLAIITIVYPPLSSSGAELVRDLAKGFVVAGHVPYIFFPDSSIEQDLKIEEDDGVVVLRFRCPETRDKSYFIRSLNEFLMPYRIWIKFIRSDACNVKLDYVVCYSPSIFFTPLIKRLKSRYSCRSYLIVRDIFPDWAVDLGLIRKNSFIHRIFSWVQSSQYRVSDVIGVQSEGNLSCIGGEVKKAGKKLEVLNNWLTPYDSPNCSIDLKNTKLAGKIIFVYAGNMGIAQGMKILISLAVKFANRDDVGFLFVGRGSEVEKLKLTAKECYLKNILFLPEIPSTEIAALYKQCHVGLLCLDRRHKSHNIPGKFVTYMYSGLPVLAALNPGNDLSKIISEHDVGMSIEDDCVDSLKISADKLLLKLSDDEIEKRCINMAVKMFSTQSIVEQILRADNPHRC